MRALVNGEPGDLISIHDRGAQFGDGVFETIAARDGGLLCWDEHFERLEAGCKRLSIPCPEQGLLCAEARELSAHAALATLKITVTRGGAGRGYTPPPQAAANRVLALYDWPDYPAARARDGIRACVCRHRLAPNPALAGIKHLNRLEQVLLRQELAATECPEGVALDLSGRVIEGTMSNLLLIKDGALIAPDLSRCGVEGVIRRLALALGQAAGLETSVRDVRLEELFEADEVFFCNSLIGVWPVRSIDDAKYDHSDMTLALSGQLRAADRIVAPP